MIIYLKGKVLEKTAQYLVLENNNLGYKVFVTPEILEARIGGHGSGLHLHESQRGRPGFVWLAGLCHAPVF